MSLFDQNQWYQITVPTFEKLSMAGMHPGASNDAAAVFFQNTNTSLASQQWQIFHSDNDTYVLRSNASGPTTYLAIRQNTTTEAQNGGLTAIMRDVEAAGDEVFWKLNTFSNGCFGLKNSANGTGWNLFVKDAATMAMTNDIKGQQDNQSFNFTRLGKIDDQKFSTLQTPTATANPRPSGNSPSNPSGSSPTASSDGLSTGAKAGIGAAIGGVALIALLVGVLFLLRRRKRKSAIKQTPIVGETSELVPSYNPSIKYGYAHSDAGQYDQHQYANNMPQELETGNHSAEMATQEPNELDGGARTSSPVELPVDHSARR